MNPEIVRMHNRRVPNPTTTYRSPGYYRFRSFCRFVVRLVISTVASVIVVGPFIAIWVFLVATLGDH